MDDLPSKKFARYKRLRRDAFSRKMVRETVLLPQDLILPIFVVEGEGLIQPIDMMPGVFRYSVDRLAFFLDPLVKRGLVSVLLFGLPSKKDKIGSAALEENSVVSLATIEIKKKFPQLHVCVDICMCEYTDHGHCGVLDEKKKIDNDQTNLLLSKQAVILAKAGADTLAPSAMSDGMVMAIRQELDKHGLSEKSIMSYSVKYASSFYGPFREAVDSSPSFGDRSYYQMDIANVREALLEVQADIDEGADIIMIKPATMFLDVVARVRERADLPIACYQISGEMAMIEAAIEKKVVEREKAIVESLISCKRAGADLIVSYFTPFFLTFYQNKQTSK